MFVPSKIIEQEARLGSSVPRMRGWHHQEMFHCPFSVFIFWQIK
jgi:hypothetical protein